MINDNPSHQLPTENGNPIHQSSSDNLTHQQPSSDNLAQFIRMLCTLSPADRQTLASVLSPSSSSTDTDPDLYLSTKPAVQTWESYDRLEEWLTSFKQRNEFFNFTKTRELEDYADVKQFHRVKHLNYAAPSLTSSKDINVHKNVFKRDQDMATIQARLAHLTRPIDATVHAILASNPMDIEDPVLINIIETFDILRYNLAFIATEITHLRKDALYRDKKIIPPADPNDKTPRISHQHFIDQEKFTHSLRKVSGQIGRGRGGSNMGNRNGQQNNNYFDNSLENSGNKNSNNGSQGSNSDASTSSNNNNNNSGNNGNHFQQSSTRGDGTEDTEAGNRRSTTTLPGGLATFDRRKLCSPNYRAWIQNPIRHSTSMQSSSQQTSNTISKGNGNDRERDSRPIRKTHYRGGYRRCDEIKS